MSDYVETFNMFQLVDKYVERVSRHIDAEVLERVESELAGYGYMKVVRCRDCAKLTTSYPMWACERFGAYLGMVNDEPDGFCKWGKRKEGGE